MNEPLPTISVIIPVTRSSSSLDACLKALSAQELASDISLEIVLVGVIAETFSSCNNARLKYIEESQMSASVRRNQGVKNCSGDILCFIDDDVRVGPHWLMNIITHLQKNPNDIIGGPNIDARSDYPFRLAAALQANPLTEGLHSHRALDTDQGRQVSIHDLPLCNVAMHRSVCEHVGGYNEEISHYLDDVEFNYIASKLGHRLMLYKDLTVQHDIRPMFLPFFTYKWETRKVIGQVFPVYACLYLDSLSIKLVLASYIFLALIIIFGASAWIPFLGIGYALAIVMAAGLYLKDTPVFLGLLVSLPVTHIIMYSGFTFGLIDGLCHFKKLNPWMAVKKRRFTFAQK